MSGKYVIVRDSYNRLRAEVTPEFAVGVRLLAEDHRRRVEHNVHAYVVADLLTELGPWRIRNISIMRNPQSQRYFVRYHQWQTGKIRDDQEEWLDVAGPLDRETRSKVQETILEVFFQIKEEAANGTLGRHRAPSPGTPSRRRDEGTGTLGDNPEVAAQLETLKEALTEEEVAEHVAAGVAAVTPTQD